MIIKCIGGCHVDGFPIGQEYAFTGVIEKVLSEEIRTDVSGRHISYIKVSQVERVRRHLASGRTDVLILQVGQFEACLGFSEWLHRKLDLGAGRSGSRGQPSGSVPPRRYASLNIGWRLWALTRVCLDTLLMHPLVDIDDFEVKLRHICDSVQESGVACSAVFVMSCFPCVDPVSDYYRRRLNKKIELCASSNGFYYVDVYSPLKDKVKSGEGIFNDPLHLNADGHALLGRNVAEVVLRKGQEGGLKVNYE